VVIFPSYDADQIPLDMASNSVPLERLNSHGVGLASTIFDAILSFGPPRIDRDRVAPRDTDTVQPKVRLRKALHHRLTDAARANKATLNGEIVRRLADSFLHQALDERLMINETTESLEKRMDQLKTLLEEIQTRFEAFVASIVKSNSSPTAVDIDLAPRGRAGVEQTSNRPKRRKGDARALAKAQSGVLGNQDRGQTP
jgi:hypothetical protein